MQVSAGRFDISREAFLADARRFGFESRQQAAQHPDALVARIGQTFESAAAPLSRERRGERSARLSLNRQRLPAPSS